MNRDSAYQPKYKYTYHKCFFLFGLFTINSIYFTCFVVLSSVAACA